MSHVEQQSPLSPPGTWMMCDNIMHESHSGIPLSDRGFRYGQHLFETVAVRNGHALFVEPHVDRLADAACKHHFGLNTHWHQSVCHFLNRTLFQDGVIRIFLTAGDGMLGARILKPQLYAFWEQASFPSTQERNQGVAVISLKKHVGNQYWGIKNGNYWDHICALQEAWKAGADEGLVFDADGMLISATMSNVILWLEKEENLIQCVTPPPSRGARDGVLLSWAREELPAIDERDVSHADLLDVRAMALTNSRLGVMPVHTLNGVMLRDRSLSLSLAKKYSSLHGF